MDGVWKYKPVAWTMWYWDKYEGYDLNKDNVGDVPYRPLSLFSVIVEQNPPAMLLYRSFIVTLLDRSEKIIPTLTPDNFIDQVPLMHIIPLWLKFSIFQKGLGSSRYSEMWVFHARRGNALPWLARMVVGKRPWSRVFLEWYFPLRVRSNLKARISQRIITTGTRSGICHRKADILTIWLLGRSSKWSRISVDQKKRLMNS